MPRALNALVTPCMLEILPSMDDAKPPPSPPPSRDSSPGTLLSTPLNWSPDRLLCAMASKAPAPPAACCPDTPRSVDRESTSALASPETAMPPLTLSSVLLAESPALLMPSLAVSDALLIPASALSEALFTAALAESVIFFRSKACTGDASTRQKDAPKTPTLNIFIPAP